MKRQSTIPEIIKETEDYFFINKPIGLTTLGGLDDRNNVKEWLQSTYPNAQIVHRLDVNTSGILLAAKNPEAYRHASEQFEKRKVEKTYHAIVGGVFPDHIIKVEAPINKTSNNRGKIDFKKGRLAITNISVLKRYSAFTLLCCKPESGRFHQIRVHLVYAGFPIAADTYYGGKVPYLSELKSKFKLNKTGEESPLIHRVALHASGLKFQSMGGEILDISAPYPKDIAVFLKQLDKYNAI